MNTIKLALLITKPGHLRNGLQSLLRTIPQLEILAETTNPSVLLKMEDIIPELILADGSLIDDNHWSVFGKVKQAWPGTKVIVLTENDQQSQSAKDAGADYSLQKGFRATELAKLIENLLNHNLQGKISSSIKDEGKA